MPYIENHRAQTKRKPFYTLSQIPAQVEMVPRILIRRVSHDMQSWRYCLTFNGNK